MPFMRACFFKALLGAAFGLTVAASARAQGQRISSPTGLDTVQRQVRLLVDVSKPIINALVPSRTSYEASLDWSVGRELYLVAEGGWGRASFDYPDLSYTSRSTFAKVGLDKSLLVRLDEKDWDGAQFGFHYGIAPVRISDARYTTSDTVWGGGAGVVPGRSGLYHWGEIAGGVRLQLVPQIFAGWNIRARFLLNQNSFPELRPSFVAGYGQGDRNTVFDFNVYVGYALRYSVVKRPKPGRPERPSEE